MDSKRRAALAILTGGLTAGVLDITYAIVFLAMNGRPPVWTLQTVSSGLLGRAAFEGGVPTALLGLLFHFVIATTAAAVYWTASRFFPVLVRLAVPAGLVFGVCVWLFMNFVVLPLSAFPLPRAYPAPAVVRGLLVHMLLIGLPIAL